MFLFYIKYITDVDPDSSGFRIRIQWYKITDKMKGKAEFNQQKYFFSEDIIFFKSEP